MSNVSELIRSANPVPETNPLSDDEVNAVLTLTLTRSGEMDVKEIMTPVEPDKSKWSGWLVAAAAFGAVVLVAGLALLLTSSDAEELPPASTPTTVAFSETTVAEDEVTQTTTAAAPTVPAGSLAAVQNFVAAMSSGDEEALHASVGPSFVYSGLVGDTVFSMEDLASWSRALAAQQTTITVDTCTAGTDSTLSCNEFHNGPVESTYGVTVQWSVHYEIADGVVASASALGCTCPRVGDVQSEIRAWVRTFDPDQAELMTSYPVFPDAAAGAAFLKYAPMWESFEGDAEAAVALGVVRAYEAAANAGDVDTFATLLAPGMTVSRDFDTNANAVSRDQWAQLPDRLIARDSVLRIEGCDPKGIDVECDVYRTGPIGNAIFFLPMRDTQTFTVVDGQILNVHVVCQLCEVQGQNGSTIISWVRTVDADAAQVMNQTWIFEDGTPESDALWLKYAVLWNEEGRP
jgi:hypothetical protein